MCSEKSEQKVIHAAVFVAARAHHTRELPLMASIEAITASTLLRQSLKYENQLIICQITIFVTESNVD